MRLYNTAAAAVIAHSMYVQGWFSENNDIKIHKQDLYVKRHADRFVSNAYISYLLFFSFRLFSFAPISFCLMWFWQRIQLVLDQVNYPGVSKGLSDVKTAVSWRKINDGHIGVCQIRNQGDTACHKNTSVFMSKTKRKIRLRNIQNWKCLN